jgi:uncharacterized membrane protein AbrB (regulator of aidB expression)
MVLVVFGAIFIDGSNFFSFLFSGSIYFCQREAGTSNATSVFSSHPGIVSNMANTDAELQTATLQVAYL